MANEGKTLCGSYCRGKGKGAIHRASAFSAANGVVLGQVKTAEKSNEITAIPKILKLLNLQGCLVQGKCMKNRAVTGFVEHH